MEVALAEAGLKVFPARTADKCPHVQGWQNKATTDKRTIRFLWRKWPDAMPALPTGSCNGFAVLDLDLKNGKDGFASLRSLGHDPENMSPVAIGTPSCGKHIYFKNREGLRCPAGQIGAGVDIRADGGSGIATGAVSESGTYGRLNFPQEPLFSHLPDWPADLAPAPLWASKSIDEKIGLAISDFRDALMYIPNDENKSRRGRTG